jgi:hypothetical protein
MTLQDLQTALQHPGVMLYVVGAVTACCCLIDLAIATAPVDLGARARRFGVRLLHAGANRRPPLVHDHTDTLSRAARRSLGLHVLPIRQPDIPMPPVQSAAGSQSSPVL